MDINLISPIILREAGLVLNDTPKLHCDDPSVEYHSLFEQETGLRIPFTLNGPSQCLLHILSWNMILKMQGTIQPYS